ncbi:MAG: hypothetical protein H5T98_03990 [Syntrophomonadaceae bacterium]|nr:hypothetical protein [Syntrophomonadaceae bacterium]
MAGKMKAAPIMLVIVFMLLIFAGCYYFLLRLNFVKAPAFLANIPAISNYVTQNQGEEPETELDKIKKENDNFKRIIAEQEQEINSLRDENRKIKQQLEAATQKESSLQGEIDQLNQDIEDLKVNKKNQQAVYKDMAGYFSAMKAADAAGILSGLDDEDIIGILGEMESESAAAILKNMERERAETVTRKMLVASP